MHEDHANSEAIDIAATVRRITYRHDGRIDQFRALPQGAQSVVFNALSATMKQEILAALSFNEAADLLDYLDPRRVHYILARMKDSKRRTRLIERIKSDRFEKIEHFLQFHPQATVSLVHSNYVYLSEGTTISESAGIIEDHLRSTGKIPVVLVHHDGELMGEVPLHSLVKERNTAKLRSYVRDVRVISYLANKEEVLSAFISTPHGKAVIKDSDGSIIGVVYSDDVIDLLEAEPAASLYNFANVESSERPFDGVWNKVRGRYRWLLINLLTCFVAAGTVSLFDEAISEFVTLAIFMPIIAGMGGNASTQTLAIMVRGIAIGEITLKNCYPAILREIYAGIVNGFICVAVLLPISLIFGFDYRIAIIASVGVIFNMIIAGLFGSIVPLILRHYGKDPATSAGVIISTATDVFGFFFLLSVATLFLL